MLGRGNDNIVKSAYIFALYLLISTKIDNYLAVLLKMM